MDLLRPEVEQRGLMPCIPAIPAVYIAAAPTAAHAGGARAALRGNGGHFPVKQCEIVAVPPRRRPGRRASGRT